MYKVMSLPSGFTSLRKRRVEFSINRTLKRQSFTSPAASRARAHTTAKTLQITDLSNRKQEVKRFKMEMFSRPLNVKDPQKSQTLVSSQEFPRLEGSRK